MRKLGGCDVDLFASRVNAQLKLYVYMFLGDQIQMLWLLMSSLWIGPNLELFVFLLSV